MRPTTYRAIATLARPIVLANASVPLLGLADTVVIGTMAELGAVALALLLRRRPIAVIALDGAGRVGGRAGGARRARARAARRAGGCSAVVADGARDRVLAAT